VRRFLFAFAAGISLILLLAIAFASVRSLRYGSGFSVGMTRWPRVDRRIRHDLALRLDSGYWVLALAKSDATVRDPELANDVRKIDESEGPVYHYLLIGRLPLDPSTYEFAKTGHLGFAFALQPDTPDVGSGTGRVVAIAAPAWSFILLTAILPVCWAISARRRFRQRREGRCRKCLYDLTGNTTGVCPECGAPTGIAHQPKAAA
jgi:hypothetical protein